MKRLLFFLLAMVFAIQGWTQISTFPWTEGFESGLTNWTQEYVSGTGNWASSTSVTMISAAQEGSHFASFSHSTSGNTTKLVSPVFDISGLTNPTLFFWYTQSNWGGDQNTTKVYYRTSSTGTWTEILYLNSHTPSWTMAQVSLPSASSTYQIAFEGYDTYGYPIGLDNISLVDLTCPSPTLPIASNATTTSFDLSWTDVTAPPSWLIEYKLSSSSTWTSETATTNPYTISNLSPSSSYQVRVSAQCSASDVSFASPTITYSTLCDAISVFPWTEGFESSWDAARSPGNQNSPNCWVNINKGSGSSN